MLITMLAVMIGSAQAGSAYDVLKQRDGADCSALGTGPEVRDELITLAEGDIQPAVVSIRAADCLVRDFGADPLVVERAAAWVADPNKAGLAIVVANAVDSLAVHDAVTIARAAVAGPDAGMRSRMIRRLVKSERPEVRNVVDEAGGGR